MTYFCYRKKKCVSMKEMANLVAGQVYEGHFSNDLVFDHVWFFELSVPALSNGASSGQISR